MVRPLSNRALGRALGVSHTAVAKAKETGRIAPDVATVEAAGRQWHANTDPRKQRPRPAAGRRAGAPPLPPRSVGYEAAFAIVEPMTAGMMFAYLRHVYALPGTVAAAAVSIGLPIGKACELANFAVVMVMREAAERWKLLTGWEGEGEGRPGPYRHDAFEPINWPYLARLAGEPDWTPPARVLGAFGWVELSAEGRDECVRRGEEAMAGDGCGT